MTTKKNNNKGLMIMLAIFSLVLAYQAIFSLSYDYDANYKNVTVDTRVNITNAPPTVLSVTIDEAINGVENITLNAGRTRTIYCNATIRDWNGWADINQTNATFWDNSVASQSDPLNNNSVYRNNSCTLEDNDGQYVSYWTCAMDIYYYANNGNDWRCNVTAVDNSSFTDSNYNITTISPLYALNVSAQLIDFGEVAVEDYSSNQTVIVYNYGNMPINTSVWGYAKYPGDNLAMNCSINSNITIENEKYSVGQNLDFLSKTSLSAAATDMGFTLQKQIDPATMMSNTTHWQLYVPSYGTDAPAGICTGNVVFEATSS
jgi:hypothetical protein